MTIKPLRFLLLSWDIQSISDCSIITVSCSCATQRGKFKALVVTGYIFSASWILFGRTGSPTSSLIALFPSQTPQIDSDRLPAVAASVTPTHRDPHPLLSPWRLHSPLTLLKQTTPHYRLTDYRPNWFVASLRIPTPRTFQPFFFSRSCSESFFVNPCIFNSTCASHSPLGRCSIQTAVFWLVYKFISL